MSNTSTVHHTLVLVTYLITIPLQGLPCTLCHDTFPKESALALHIKQHSYPFECSFCSRFSLKYIITIEQIFTILHLQEDQDGERGVAARSNSHRVSSPANNISTNKEQSSGFSCSRKAVVKKGFFGHFETPDSKS